ncbi:hypothetical protein V2I01_00515 [Micromonospora sp. BRA006-A]|nr:hypothetical protein [Micromonospora sp. BRA006-A]
MSAPRPGRAATRRNTSWARSSTGCTRRSTASSRARTASSTGRDGGGAVGVLDRAGRAGRRVRLRAAGVEMMSSYWPQVESISDHPHDLAFAPIWRRTPKVVVSRTLAEASHGAVVVGGGDLAKEFAEVRERFPATCWSPAAPGRRRRWPRSGSSTPTR